jgi:ubiquinone/menaquinone biosynthesis C-methylase UbiE
VVFHSRDTTTEKTLSSRQLNFGLKEQIAEYWTARSANFDSSPGHGIAPGAERAAWNNILTASLGSLEGKRVLELACGTGEFTSLLVGAGADVTGLDLSPGMLAKARAKVPSANLHGGDAEDTMEPSAAYDAVVCRHLVWTLPDPAAAFADWFRVLRPGGRLLVIDGDWVRLPVLGRLARAVGNQLMTLARRPPEYVDWPAHEAIMRQVHFREGLRAEPLARMLRAAGFDGMDIGSLSQVRRAQRKAADFPRSLTVGVYRDFWMGAAKAS